MGLARAPHLCNLKCLGKRDGDVGGSRQAFRCAVPGLMYGINEFYECFKQLTPMCGRFMWENYLYLFLCFFKCPSNYYYITVRVLKTLMQIEKYLVAEIATNYIA